ncbi:MAG: hypothetical protein KIT84_20710 [Labilithrix sp.]|nr:hypothetical protein [Labilithrix sp.]MCW5813463.1 hypothetical protein [Labilithrix sp.]
MALTLLVATPAWAYPRVATETTTAENAPFRAKLILNASIARRAATTLRSIAKQQAPAKLSATEKKRFAEHSKWLSDSAAKMEAVHERMQKVLAKGDKAPATEIATMSMEFVNLRDAIEAEARRFADLKPAAARHAAAMNAVRAEK